MKNLNDMQKIVWAPTGEVIHTELFTKEESYYLRRPSGVISGPFDSEQEAVDLATIKITKEELEATTNTATPIPKVVQEVRSMIIDYMNSITPVSEGVVFAREIELTEKLSAILGK